MGRQQWWEKRIDAQDDPAAGAAIAFDWWRAELARLEPAQADAAAWALALDVRRHASQLAGREEEAG